METMYIETTSPKAAMSLRSIAGGVSSSAELQSIQRGLDDFRQGRTVAHSQVRKRYEQWL
jgi:predicted transcriptional regulator